MTASRYRARIIREAVRQRRFAKVLDLCGSHERAPALVSWRDGLSDDEVRELLSEFWSVTEAWSGNDELREGMIDLLRRVAPLIVLGEDEDGEVPSGLLTIYRGNLGEDPRLGHSWSLDWETARVFALMATGPRGRFLGIDRDDGEPTVWRAQIAAQEILGYFNCRREREVVVDPSGLRDVERAGAAGRDPRRTEAA